MTNVPELVASQLRPAESKIRVLAYNAHLLPRVATKFAGHRSRTEYRARAIGERLAEYDLVGICEAFDRNATQTLLGAMREQRLGEFTELRGPARSGRHWIGGGLLLISRYPLIESHSLTFKNAPRILSDGLFSDGLAAKGALHARLAVPNSFSGGEPVGLDCFLTHLESQSTTIRTRQINELQTFIRQHAQPGRPVLVFGDFNVPAKGPGYSPLMASLAGEHFAMEDAFARIESTRSGTSDALAEDGGRRIDYVFVGNPRGAATATLQVSAQRTLPFLDSKVPEGSLSDHLGLECQLELFGPK